MTVMRGLRGVIAAAAMMFAFAALPAAAEDAKPQTLKIASFNIGGSWYIYAQAIADLAQKVLPTGSNVEVLPYQGGVANPMLVNRGAADLGLSFTALSNWAYQGKILYKAPNADIRALVGGLSSPHRLAVIARPSLGIASLADIKAQKKKVRLVTVQLGGAGEALASIALEAYGMSYKDIEAWGGTVTHLDIPVALERLQNGQADLFIHNVGFKQPDIVELALSADLKFLPLGEAEMTAIVEKYGLEPGLAFRAGEFKGIAQDIPAIGYPTGVIASKNLSDDVAYTLTKVICENQAALAAAHASLKDFDPTKAFLPGMNGNVPLHPGAVRYYKEKGLM